MTHWNYIDEYDSCPWAKFIHCDTRDFHILCTNEGNTMDIIKQCRKFDIEKAKFCRGEILGMLKELEQASGGKGEWRFLCFDFSGTDHKEDRSWVKYIRFVRTDEFVDKFGHKEPVYIAYMTRADKVDQLIERDWHRGEYVDKDAIENSFMKQTLHGDNLTPLEPKVVTCKTMDDLEKALS